MKKIFVSVLCIDCFRFLKIPYPSESLNTYCIDLGYTRTGRYIDGYCFKKRMEKLGTIIRERRQ